MSLLCGKSMNVGPAAAMQARAQHHQATTDRARELQTSRSMAEVDREVSARARLVKHVRNAELSDASTQLAYRQRNAVWEFSAHRAQAFRQARDAERTSRMRDNVEERARRTDALMARRRMLMNDIPQRMLQRRSADAGKKRAQSASILDEYKKMRL